MSGSTPDLDPIERLAAEFADRLRRGERPSLNEYVDRYPELAFYIRELFPALLSSSDSSPIRTTKKGLRRRRFLWLFAKCPTSWAITGSAIPGRRGNGDRVRGGAGIAHLARGPQGHAPAVSEPQELPVSISGRGPLAAQLHHTNIVSVFDYGEHDGVCFYAMQYIPGHSLDRILDDLRLMRTRKLAQAWVGRRP